MGRGPKWNTYGSQIETALDRALRLQPELVEALQVQGRYYPMR